jgi:hypothetical protein
VHQVGFSLHDYIEVHGQQNLKFLFFVQNLHLTIAKWVCNMAKVFIFVIRNSKNVDTNSGIL